MSKLAERSILVSFLLCLYTLDTNCQIRFSEQMPGPAFADARNGSIAHGDIDNDGDIDIFIAGNDANQLKSSLYTNDGLGNFTLLTDTTFAEVQFGDSKFSDVDNDGDLDLLITGSNLQPSSFANLYTNDGSGNFSLVSNTPFQASSSGDIAFEDIDNDGDQDVMIVGYNSLGNLFSKLYQNNGLGVFIELTTNFIKASGPIAFFDYDNDGDQDVIIAGGDTNSITTTTLYSNNGSGLYTIVPSTPFLGTKDGDIGISDTDNDGDLDILLNGYVSGTTKTSTIYLNDSSGVFSVLANTNFPQTSLGNVEFADFDNDGDEDVLISGSITGSQFASHVFENTGSNNFIILDTLNPMYFTSTAVADIDGDNDLDVIMVGIQNSTTAFKTRTFVNNSPLVGISENQIDIPIHIYPNPASNVVNIQLESGQLKRIEVYDLIGKLIYNESLSADRLILNVIDYPKGTYILRLVNQNSDIATIRLIKD